VARNPLSEHHPLVYSQRKPTLAMHQMSSASKILLSAMKAHPNQQRNSGLALQLRGGKQFSGLLWLADKASGLLSLLL